MYQFGVKLYCSANYPLISIGHLFGGGSAISILASIIFWINYPPPKKKRCDCTDPEAQKFSHVQKSDRICHLSILIAFWCQQKTDNLNFKPFIFHANWKRKFVSEQVVRYWYNLANQIEGTLLRMNECAQLWLISKYKWANVYFWQLMAILNVDFANGFEKWKRSWDKSVKFRGKYFEEDS